MIQIIVDPESMKIATSRLQSKVRQAEFAVSPTSMTEIAKAAFTITAKKFIRDISLEAKSYPQKYHHIYEWNKVGNPASKLFILKRLKVQYGNLIVGIETINSNTFVPIHPELLSPGPTGKTVSSRYIFKEKARIMEEGRPVEISSNKIMAFYADSVYRDTGVYNKNVVFVPAGQSITIKNPGGDQTKNALKEYAHEWYMTRPAMIIQSSRIIGQIGNAVAGALNLDNSSNATVLKAIKSVTTEYSQDISVM